MNIDTPYKKRAELHQAMVASVQSAYQKEVQYKNYIE